MKFIVCSSLLRANVFLLFCTCLERARETPAWELLVVRLFPRVFYGLSLCVHLLTLIEAASYDVTIDFSDCSTLSTTKESKVALFLFHFIICLIMVFDNSI
jgi:hypothetical protein